MNPATTKMDRVVNGLLLSRRVKLPAGGTGARRTRVSWLPHAHRMTLLFPPQLDARAVIDRENPLLPCGHALRRPI